MMNDKTSKETERFEILQGNCRILQNITHRLEQDIAETTRISTLRVFRIQGAKSISTDVLLMLT